VGVWDRFIADANLAETLDHLGLCRFYVIEPRNGHESPSLCMESDKWKWDEDRERHYLKVRKRRLEKRRG